MAKRPSIESLREYWRRMGAQVRGRRVVIPGQPPWEILLTDDSLEAFQLLGGTIFVANPDEKPKSELAARRQGHFERDATRADREERPNQGDEARDREIN